jgi:hypothetical protein
LKQEESLGLERKKQEGKNEGTTEGALGAFV